MGLLRLLLAIGVATEHSGYAIGAGSYVAVQAFFIISGFYMSLVLSSGAYSSKKKFYASRFLRLYPIYWAILIIALIYFFIAYKWGIETTFFSFLSEANTSIIKKLLLIFSNIFVIGSDYVWFWPHLFGSTHSVHYLIVVPVWTLSLELMFYLLCPFLIKISTKNLFKLTFLLIIIRVIAYYFGVNHPPFHARFIGFEFCFFLFGLLSHRVHESGRWIPEQYDFALSIITLLITLLFNIWSRYFPTLYAIPNFTASIIFCFIISFALPSLFRITKQNKIDRYIGEYSYPVYLIHYIFVPILIHSNLLSGLRGMLLILSLSFLHSAVIIHFVQNQIDYYRHAKYRSSHQNTS